MDKRYNEIAEFFALLNLHEKQYPHYCGNPNQFAKTFKKCRILEYKNISYNNNSENFTLYNKQ